MVPVILNNITVTEAAQLHFTKLLEQQPKNTGIRVFVINPGTSDAECGVSYCPPDAVESSDTEMRLEKFSVFFDKRSLPFLEGAVIDLITDRVGSQLTLKAPNAKVCMIPESASLTEQVEYVIQNQVNPQLASHGGHIRLLEITVDGIAVIQFGGGCNGCSMVDVTLKNGIEKELLHHFPGQITAVCDSTEHNRGNHSFY